MKNWIKDIVALVIAIVLWTYSSDIIRLFDPTAGADDPGILQALIFKAVILLTVHFFTKMFLRIFWPSVDDYLATMFNFEFRQDICYKRYWLAAFCYFTCMMAWVIAAV